MPFIDFEEPDHTCRTPGRRVGYGTTWYCDQCRLVYRWDECLYGDVRCKPHFWEGHWSRTGEVHVKEPVRLVERPDLPAAPP